MQNTNTVQTKLTTAKNNYQNFSFTVSKDDVDTLQNNLNSTQIEIDNLNTSLSEYQTQINALNGSINDILTEQEVVAIQSEITQLEAQITGVNIEIEVQTTQLEITSEQLSASTAVYETELAQHAQMEAEINTLEVQLQEAQQLEQQTLDEVANKEVTPDLADFFRDIFN